MNAITKKVVAVMAAVVMAVTAAVSVSADYINVDKYGLYYPASGSVKQIFAGDTIPSNVYNYNARWSLSNLTPDYTYDIFLDIIFQDSVNLDKITLPENGDTLFYSIKNPNLWYPDSNTNYWTKIANVNGSIEKISDKHIKLHVFYNYNTFGLNYSTLQISLPFYSYLGGMTGIKVMSMGVGCYYDPGGDTYTQLIYEYGQGNPLPDVKDIKDQGNAMSSAEAAVRDKSDNLVASVESDWSAMQSTAKAGVTSLQPAAATVNSAFGLVMDELPDEVKILFVAIPILLFIGWLIGRVRE